MNMVHILLQRQNGIVDRKGTQRESHAQALVTEVGLVGLRDVSDPHTFGFAVDQA